MLLTIFAKSSIIDVRRSSEYAFVTCIQILEYSRFNLVNFLKFINSIYQDYLHLLYFANKVLGQDPT